MLMTLLILISLITFTMIFVAFIISQKTWLNREKMSPFECGFDPMNSARYPFSINFFLITIIFLIFDIEIALLLPIIFLINSTNLLYLNLMMLMFTFILLVGLYHEWNQGALTWMI